MLPVRFRHRRRSRKKHEIRASAIATVTTTLRGATNNNADSTRKVFNVGLYLLLLDQDLADFTDDLIEARGDRRRRFIAKHEAILLYEAAEDLPQLLGKDFRNAVASLGATDQMMKRLNEASSGLNKYWQQHREFLGKVRNAIAAHREHDALHYIEAVDTLAWKEVAKCAVEMSVHLNNLITVLTEIALLTSNAGVILRDLICPGSKPRPRSNKSSSR